MSKKLLINELKYMQHLNNFMSSDITESFLVDELEDIQEENPIQKVKGYIKKKSDKKRWRDKRYFVGPEKGKKNPYVDGKYDWNKSVGDETPYTKDYASKRDKFETQAKAKNIRDKRIKNAKTASKNGKPSKAPSIPRRGR